MLTYSLIAVICNTFYLWDQYSRRNWRYSKPYQKLILLNVMIILALVTKLAELS
jgi:hypothetical protein